MRALPWITVGAMAFLTKYVRDHPQMKVLEFGAGGSTLWLAKHSRQIVSVEHVPEWAVKVKERVAEMAGDGILDMRCLPRPYDSVCDGFRADHFDLVFVDGRDRVRCVAASIRCLKPGGVLMLDNSDRLRYAPVRQRLADWSRTDAVQEDAPWNAQNQGRWTTTWWIKPGGTS